MMFKMASIHLSVQIKNIYCPFGPQEGSKTTKQSYNYWPIKALLNLNGIGYRRAAWQLYIIIHI